MSYKYFGLYEMILDKLTRVDIISNLLSNHFSVNLIFTFILTCFFLIKCDLKDTYISIIYIIIPEPNEHLFISLERNYIFQG